jgi:hypothetical protein
MAYGHHHRDMHRTHIRVAYVAHKCRRIALVQCGSVARGAAHGGGIDAPDRAGQSITVTDKVGPVSIPTSREDHTAVSDDLLLSRLDLNLLVSLDALLTERSVTRAAERLHLSQPALSASLARLRRHFDDQILARRGNTYELTPLALRLVEHTATALDAARRVFESQATWDPRESTREFVIYGSDYSFATVGRRASRIARDRAPGVRFRFQLHNPQVVEDATTKLRSADAMLIPHGFLVELPYQDLWRDRWMVIADEDNTAVGDEVTMEFVGPCLPCHKMDAIRPGLQKRLDRKM